MNKPNETADKKENPKVQLDKLSLVFLNSNNTQYSEVEMEAKFGTKGHKQITKIDYDNVVKKLKSLYWRPNSNSGEYLLRIQIFKNIVKQII